MENEIIEPSPIFDSPETIPPRKLWKTSDAWIGLGILMLLLILFVTVSISFNLIDSTSSLLLIIPELLMLVPVAIILLWRKVSWKEIGFYKFKWEDLALGCGLLLFIYFLSIINNLVMMMLGVITQAETIFDVLTQIDSLVVFAIATMLMAPTIEEIFFRGFLFKGFREKYGWKIALVLSSIIFSLFHGQIATLIPTFLLGALFSYMVQRTESVFPGMILHFIINSIGTCGLLAAYQFGGL